MCTAGRFWNVEMENGWEVDRKASDRDTESILLANYLYCAYQIFGSYIGPRVVDGQSMLPTSPVETEWVSKDVLSVRCGRPLERGELVILDSPRRPGGQICKRILGLPGDVVCVDPTDEGRMSREHVLIAPGHIWIIGDNAVASIDSREYGLVPMALVRSEVLARISPWRKRTIFRSNIKELGEC